jgi:hypothetical protein
MSGLPQSTINITTNGMDPNNPAQVIAEIVSTAIQRGQPVALPAGAGLVGRGGGGGGGRGGGRGAAGAAGAAGSAGAATAATASSADAASTVPPRWRITISGMVFRSTDGLQTWQPVSLDPSLKLSGGELTGGVATSPAICWLIGRAGLILRAVDGLHFARLQFPELVDLAAINATGAADATVTTTTGHVYVTTDGGLTWKLQGLPAASF